MSHLQNLMNARRNPVVNAFGLDICLNPINHKLIIKLSCPKLHVIFDTKNILIEFKCSPSKESSSVSPAMLDAIRLHY